MSEPAVSMQEIASGVDETTGEEQTVDTNSSETTETGDEHTGTPASQPQNHPEEAEFDPVSVLETLQLDPKVKEKMKAGYLRQSDYTKKTQEIAQIRKRAEEYDKVLPIVQKVFSDEELLNRALGISPGNREEEIPEDPKAYADWVKQQAVREATEIMRRERVQQETEARQNQDFAAAEQVDPRLNEDPKFGQTIVALMTQNKEFMQGKISAVEATKQAIEFFDGYVTNAQVKAKQDLVDRAKQRRTTISSGSSPVSTGEGTPKSMREAAKLAEAEIASR